MEFLVPLMPLLGALPLAVATVVVARMFFAHRERMLSRGPAVEELQAQVESLHAGQVDLQERLDFTERLVGQLREQARLGPPQP